MPAGRDQVLRLGAEKADRSGCSDRARPRRASSIACGVFGDREEAARRLVDADVGRLRREQHRDQQLERRSCIRARSRACGLAAFSVAKNGAISAAFMRGRRAARARGRAPLRSSRACARARAALGGLRRPPDRRACPRPWRCSRASFSRASRSRRSPCHVVALPRLRPPAPRSRRPSRCARRCHREHGDAVDRADRYAQLAAGAKRLDHGVHLLVMRRRCVGRAGLACTGCSRCTSPRR